MAEKVGLSVLIPARNAAESIGKTLESVHFADEVIVLDNGSVDETQEVAIKRGAIVIEGESDDFSKLRNTLLEKAKHNFVLYVDADEVVSKKLAEKIGKLVQNEMTGVYRIRRVNYFLGKKMYDDYVERFFDKDSVIGWQGKVHEHIERKAGMESQTVEVPLIHTTHTSITSMLEKTNEWSEVEADLRLQAHHPPISWWRLLRIALSFFVGNYFGKKLWKYGREGLFEAYFQMVDKVIVYTKLWEEQHIHSN
jgi:glycosyltransferase involved in cell wall biosynthesis